MPRTTLARMLITALAVCAASCFESVDPCEPDCSGRRCGPDPVCGLSCGDCRSGHTCIEGICVEGEEEAIDGGDPDGDDFEEPAPGNEGAPPADDGGLPDHGPCHGLTLDCRHPASDDNPQGPDDDGDGWGVCCDCDDGNDRIHPIKPEVVGDGVDDNCNGLTDEPGGAMVQVPGYDRVWIDVYETSVFGQPGCTGTRYGVAGDDYPAEFPADGTPPTVQLYACSLPGVLPSAHLSWYRARYACQAQGKRLCGMNEWGAACGQLYPYEGAFDAGVCNDALGGAGALRETGAYPGCTSESGTYDQSGNLMEWLREWHTEDGLLNAWLQPSSWACVVCFEEEHPDDFCILCDQYASEYYEPKIRSAADCVIMDHHENLPRAMAAEFMGARCCLEID
jgi:hypothetical protein